MAQVKSNLTYDDELLLRERKLLQEGFAFIAGVDEAGRGPLAGPVVAAAVVLPREGELPGVFDSKQLSDARRRVLRDEIMQIAEVGIGVADVQEIDSLNILKATHLAMHRAVAKLEKVEFVLVDGLPVAGFPCPAENVIKGDAKSASIAAASIVAKVYRDEVMEELDEIYPGYGFASHKGYGTAVHLESLRRLGVTPVHRRSFGPVRDLIDPPPEQLELFQ